MSQTATFEISLVVVDKPTDRKRWNGGPMASTEAVEALNAVVDKMQDEVRNLGFDIVRTGYGVTAHRAS